jgi:7-cyano-7-deazaguanine synthase
MKNKKVVLILSGGLDSTTLMYDLVKKYGRDNVYALSFDYGQKHRKELLCARNSCKLLGVNHKIVGLGVLNQLAPSALTREDWKVPEGHYEAENMKQTVVPNRNMVLLSLATSYAIGLGADKLYYGAHAGDHHIYADCRKEFVDKMKEAIKICDFKKVELVAPYWNIDKGDIVIKGLKLGVRYEYTWTCYAGKKKACGKCGACCERLEAFKKAKKEDPIRYAI